jgi:hypothetical protein
MRAIGQYLVLLVLSFTLVACGGSSSGKSKDTTPPSITLTGNNPQVIEAGTQYVELGATATDNRDGDLSNAIVIDASQVDTSVPGTYVVSYRVSDAAGNSGSASRTVVIEDTMPPVITLLGDDPQIIVAGNPYNELGATASDMLDGDLSAQIVTDATAVDTMVAGDYIVTYDVMDAAGNTAVTVTRTVRVELPPPPAVPQVTMEGDIKQLIFSWDDVADADYYRLMENADGHSGFTQVGDDIPIGTHSATRDIAVHLLDWVDALYMVQACNLGGCTSSAEGSAKDLMLDTIGFIAAPELAPVFGNGVVLSQDGKTLAVSKSDSVYIFRQTGVEWYQQSVVVGSNTETGDGFGYMTALSANGNTLAVGAYMEDSSSIGINGDPHDNTVENSGAVYLFRFEEEDWHQQAYVKASNTDRWDFFGRSVTLSANGNTLAVGASNEDSNAIGINGDQADNSAYYAGAVYLFGFDGMEWQQQAYIKASNTEEWDHFGEKVTLSAEGNTLVVGTFWEDSNATGINGEQADNSAAQAGAVYVFRFDGTDWRQQAYVKASNAGREDWFGYSVALSSDGDTLAVGARFEDSSATGVNGDQADNSAYQSGAVYVFRFDGMDWHQQAYVKASNTGTGVPVPDCDPRYDRWCEGTEHEFGTSVTLTADGNLLAVGAPQENSNATGINGDETDVSAPLSGAVYVFHIAGTDWSQRAYVKAPNTERGDQFGISIALNSDGDTLVALATRWRNYGVYVY